MAELYLENMSDDEDLTCSNKDWMFVIAKEKIDLMGFYQPEIVC